MHSVAPAIDIRTYRYCPITALIHFMTREELYGIDATFLVIIDCILAHGATRFAFRNGFAKVHFHGITVRACCCQIVLAYVSAVQ